MDYFKINNKTKNELNNIFYHYLNNNFNININTKYLYIYEEAFVHLLKDSERIFNKNYNDRNIKFNRYVIQENRYYLRTIFVKNMYSHVTLINNLKCDSIKFKNKIRKDKLNKIRKK